MLRQYIRAVIAESWSDHLDTVMQPGHGMGEEDEEDEEEGRHNKDAGDPYGGAGESRGKKPNSLATSSASAAVGSGQKAGTGMGSGPQGGRNPGGSRQGGFHQGW